VALDEGQIDALYQLGITYTAQQEKGKAIETFEKYLKVDPDSERAAQVKSFLDYLKK
jgi:cytochrome c-type biogenesis protein CcmH/NrfG